MSDEKDNASEKTTEKTTEKIYEATWAPADPRDLSGDDTASARAKLGSKVRIVGAMHPVLNLLILGYDAIVNRSKMALFVLVIILVSLVAIFWAVGAFSTAT